MLIGINLLLAAFLLMLVLSPMGFWQNFGSVGLNSFDSISYMLGLTMLSKIVMPHSRGTLFNLFSFIGSIGVLISNEAAGQLFEHVSHIAPFMMLLCGFAVLIV
jgi:hypothetical protein